MMNKPTFYEVPNLQLPGISRKGGVAEVIINGDKVEVKLSQEVPGTANEWVHSTQEMSLEDFNAYIKPMLKA